MTIELQLFLNIYYGFLAVYLLCILFNTYHFIKFGFFTFGSIFFSLVFLVGTVLLIYFSLTLINTIDWSTTFTIFEFNPAKEQKLFPQS